MRRLIYVIVALAIVGIATGCNKDKDAKVTLKKQIVGSWHGVAEDADTEVYVSFTADGAYDLYKRVGEGRFRLTEGTWQLEGTTLMGSDSDNTAWGDSYTVAVSKNTMTLTAQSDATAVYTLTRADIPAEVIEQGALKSDMRIIGSWHCTVEEFDAEVYVSFGEDSTFDLYQRLGEGRYRHYEGTWALDIDILTGVYADNEAWGDSYTVAYADDDTMTLTATISGEVMTYLREDIPTEVIEESIATRADNAPERPIL